MMAAKKTTAKPKMSDADAKKKIEKEINAMLASGNAMKNFPTAKSLRDVLPDTIGEGSLRPKLGDKKFYALANAAANKAHARLKAAAVRGDMSRAVLQPSTRTTVSYQVPTTGKKTSAPKKNPLAKPKGPMVPKKNAK
jgi:hypothetical protein